VREFKPDRAIDAPFIALPTAAFTVDGPHAASAAARIDAGAKLAIAQTRGFSQDSMASSRHAAKSYASNGGARVTW
jgi:hypothetical protein